MKTSRLISVVLCVMVVASTMLVACAPEQALGIEAPNVSLTSCLPSFVGSESVCLVPIFKIGNPNDFIVCVQLEYGLKVDGQEIGKSQVPQVYVPARRVAGVRDTIVVPFQAWFAGEAMGGKTPKDAMMSVAPFYKALGGKRPAVVPEALWDKLPVSKPTITAEGYITVFTDSERQVFQFRSQWLESE